MSLDPSNSDDFDESLEFGARAIRRLEIDTYRLRTNFTRLEAAIEDGGAIREPEAPLDDDERAHRRPNQPSHPSIDAATAEATPAFEFLEPIESQFAHQSWEQEVAPFTGEFGEPDDKPQRPDDSAADDDGTDIAELSSNAVLGTQPERKYRYTTPPVLASLSLHGVLLLAIVSITVATIVHDEKPFTTTFIDLGDKPPELIPLENFDLGPIAKLDETNLQDADIDSNLFDSAVPIVDDVSPVDFESLAGPKSVGDLARRDRFEAGRLRFRDV